jgi:putative addiction module component (TIGR02574 family)
MPESTDKTAEDIYAEVARLSPAERDKLVAMLNQEYPQPESAVKIDKVWVDELRRRVDLLRAGEMATVPADEAIQRARAKLATGRK